MPCESILSVFLWNGCSEHFCVRSTIALSQMSKRLEWSRMGVMNVVPIMNRTNSKRTTFYQTCNFDIKYIQVASYVSLEYISSQVSNAALVLTVQHQSTDLT